MDIAVRTGSPPVRPCTPTLNILRNRSRAVTVAAAAYDIAYILSGADTPRGVFAGAALSAGATDETGSAAGADMLTAEGT